MSDLLETLYIYLQEERLSGLLTDMDYRSKSRAAGLREQELRDSLTGDDLHALEVLLDLRGDLLQREEAAIFRAALTLGMELARL